MAFAQSESCDHVTLTIEPTTWTGISVVTGRISDHWSKWQREIPVTTAQGRVIGFLSPKFRAGVTQKSLLLGEEDSWEGYFRSGEILNGELYLHYPMPLLSAIPCRYTTSSS